MDSQPKPPQPWREYLSQTLNQLASRAPGTPLRVAVVGIGQALRGDDGAGSAIARELAVRLAKRETLLVLDAGTAPENVTGVLRRHGASLVVLVDAAVMGAAPGSLRWLAWRESSGMTASTHTLPPYLLALYLTNMLGCEVLLLGIQPADTALGAPLSAAAAEAVEEAAAGLAAVLSAYCLPEKEDATSIGN